MTDDLLDMSPQQVRQAYHIIEESIEFHKAQAEDPDDKIVWMNVTFEKKRGVKFLEAMLALETNPRRKTEVRTNKKYWERNYDSIRKNVYKRD
ncbi:MAG: hypothetical protein RL557_171 [archaeon]|jgi:hypothetical protein